MKQKVNFIVCELGRQTDNFMLHLFAALAEKERELISTRTRAALQALKSRGVKLGSPNPANGGKIAGAKIRAETFARDTPLIAMAGSGTLEEQAARLNAAGLRTLMGKLFTRATVLRLRRRAASTPS